MGMKVNGCEVLGALAFFIPRGSGAAILRLFFRFFPHPSILHVRFGRILTLTCLMLQLQLPPSHHAFLSGNAAI